MIVDTVTEKVKRAQLKKVAFLVEYHLPFEAMDHLSDLVTDIFADSKLHLGFRVNIIK